MPRKGRRKLRSPVQNPSAVLTWTSRIPSASRSLAHTRAPGVWQTLTRVRPEFSTRLYPLHSSVLTVAFGALKSSTWGCKSTMRLEARTCSRACPVSRPKAPTTGGRSLSQVPCPRTLFPRRRGGSAGSRWGTPFFPRILVHLIHFHHRVGQRGSRRSILSVGLNAVTQIQQMRAVSSQFSGQVCGALPLRKALQNSDDLRARSVRTVPDGAGKGIVDSSATTTVVQHRSAITPMDAAFRCGPLATITAQTLGMQVVDQPIVAS